jgi:hypothetical protein
MLDDSAIQSVIDGLSARKATHIANQVSEYRRSIDSISTAVEDYRRHITTRLLQLSNQRDLLNIALSAEGDTSYVDHLLEEWADLSKHPRLESASMDDGIIVLQTTDDIRLHREDSDETRWLGRFRITLNLDNGGIQLNNLDTRRGGRDHPHVVNGTPCFGADHGIFSELMAAGSLNLLYEMLLQYLEKLNLRDEYGAYGSYWFEQDDVRPEGAPRPEAPAVDTTEVMGAPEYAERYGVGAEFIIAQDRGRDRAGRRGVITSPVTDDHWVELRYLDNDEIEQRADGLRVRGVEAGVFV